MKKVILILSLGLISCGHEPKTVPAAEQEINPPEHKEISTTQEQDNSTDGDPTFVVPHDTISIYGPNSITRGVLQDKNGIIWLATWEGIISYNSSQFTNVTIQEGLKHFHAVSILEDRTGNLWFGTVGGGVYRYNAHLNSGAGHGKGFTLFTTSDGLAGDEVMCMLEDKTGIIWFGTTKGVSRYNGNSFINFTKQDGLGDNFISSIAQDKTGKLWFATNGGINCYDPSATHLPGAKPFTAFPINKDQSFHNVRTIVEDRTGIIWIGSEEGLWHYDGKSLNNISKNTPSYIFEDKTGNLWLNAGGTNRPNMILYRYDGSKKEPSGQEKSFAEIIVNNNPRAPFFNQIFGITEDRDGSIWFGTADGVCRYDGKSFHRFTKDAPMK